MRYAKDIMTSHPTVLELGSYLNDIASLFVDKPYHSFPVVGKDQKAVGILTEVGFLKAVARMNKTPQKKTLFHYQEYLESVPLLSPESTVTEIIPHIVSKKYSRVLVVAPSKVLLGIISPKDILRVLTGENRRTIDMEKQFRQAHLTAREMLRKETSGEVASAYFQIFDNSPFLMFAMDPKGTVLSTNKRLDHKLGVSDHELEGKNVSELYPHFAQAAVVKGIEQVLKEGSLGVHYTAFKTKSQGILPIDISYNAVKSQNGQVICITAIAREVASNDLYQSVKEEIKALE